MTFLSRFIDRIRVIWRVRQGKKKPECRCKFCGDTDRLPLGVRRDSIICPLHEPISEDSMNRIRAWRRHQRKQAKRAQKANKKRLQSKPDAT